MNDRSRVTRRSFLIWEKLLDRADLDAVIIATPWDWHGWMAVAAMRTDKYPGAAQSWLGRCAYPTGYPRVPPQFPQACPKVAMPALPA
jgi:hypothetical protein